jgi:hypothetical protein
MVTRNIHLKVFRKKTLIYSRHVLRSCNMLNAVPCNATVHCLQSLWFILTVGDFINNELLVRCHSTSNVHSGIFNILYQLTFPRRLKRYTKLCVIYTVLILTTNTSININI